MVAMLNHTAIEAGHSVAREVHNMSFNSMSQEEVCHKPGNGNVTKQEVNMNMPHCFLYTYVLICTYIYIYLCAHIANFNKYHPAKLW